MFAISAYLNQSIEKPDFQVSKQDSTTNINRDFLKFISMGNKRLFSNVLWIMTLIESDNERYEKKDYNNWMYHRFRTISELDPLFYENYIWGGMYLSIIKNDLEGASDIYERGLAHYPDDYKLNYNAGFNYYFEMGKFPEGLKLLEKIENHPDSPKPLKFIINKLRFETQGNYDVALQFLIHSINANKDPVLDKKLRNDFFALKAERDLKCLNEKQKGCDYRDAEGNSYLEKNGTWVAAREFVPYKIHLRQK